MSKEKVTKELSKRTKKGTLEVIIEENEECS